MVIEMNMGNNNTNNLVYRKSTNKYFLEESNFNEKMQIVYHQ